MNNSKTIIESSNPSDVPATDSNETTKHSSTPAIQGPIGDIIIANPHKINVDDNFHVLNLSGYSLRLQWSFVVMNYCRNNTQIAKKIYECLFINHDEFYFPTSGGPNRIYRQAFDQEFGIIITDKRAKAHPPRQNTMGTLVTEGKWLLNFEEEIIQAIDTYQRVQIVAPTGTGKTVLMNHIASKRKCIIVTPFNSQLSLYNKVSLPSPTVVPTFIFGQAPPNPTPEEIEGEKIAKSDFNVVRSTETSIENKKEVHFDESTTNICVWDQFVNKIHDINTTFKDHIIIVDESHLLFSDRSYRKSAVKFIKLINQFKGKVVLVTATPTWEHELLHIDNTLTFRRARKPVILNWIDSKNPYNTIERLIGVLRNTQSKIVVFSDVNARKLYENCIAKEKYEVSEITMFHSKFLDHQLNNAIEVMRKEVLDRQLTICTRIAYAGINFKNENEKIIVVIEVTPNTDYAYVTQALGRIRKAEVEAYVVSDKREHSVISVKDRMAAAEELKHHSSNPVVDSFLIDYEKYTNWFVEKQLEKYFSSEADKVVIIEKLRNSGYISVLDYGGDYYACRRKEQNEYKREESELFIKEIINQNVTSDQRCATPLEFTQFSASYWQIWIVKYNNIIFEVNPKDVELYTTLRKKNTSIEVDTILGELEDLIKLCKMPDNIRNELKNNYMNHVKKVTEGWETPLAIKLVKDKCKYLSDILNRVDVKKVNTISNDLLWNDVFNPTIGMITETKLKLTATRSKNGKKGDRNKKSEGGKKGNREGKSEGGRKGGKKSSRKQAITLQWIGNEDQRPNGLDVTGKISFGSKTLCQKYLGACNACFYDFCNTNCGAVKLRKKWKVVKQ